MDSPIIVKTKPWFKSWFDTPYYHILYKDRDDNEACLLMDSLSQELGFEKGSHILDLACGRGRHAKYLSELGYEVTGLDLSEKNIEYAKKFENEKLHFERADMRLPFGVNRFDSIFNIFTSFGYFDSQEDNLKTCLQIRKALKPNGNLVLDFMNVNKVKLGLVEEEVREVEGIEFRIERVLEDNKVIKKIRFTDKGEDFYFEEKVQLLELEDFEHLFTRSGLVIKSVYGDFSLNDFNAHSSERLILFAQTD